MWYSWQDKSFIAFTSAKSTQQKEKERDFGVPLSAVRSISLILTFPNLIRSAGSWGKIVLGLINSKFDKRTIERRLAALSHK